MICIRVNRDLVSKFKLKLSKRCAIPNHQCTAVVFENKLLNDKFVISSYLYDCKWPEQTSFVKSITFV